MKLMIVDDSNIIRNKIERANIAGEYKVIAKASDGVEAISLFNANKPDIVTMDLTMPNMDGIDCIEKLISLRDDLLILVVSALNDKSTAIEAIKRGAHGFLCKPFTDAELRDALNELVRGAA